MKANDFFVMHVWDRFPWPQCAFLGCLTKCMHGTCPWWQQCVALERQLAQSHRQVMMTCQGPQGWQMAVSSNAQLFLHPSYSVM